MPLSSSRPRLVKRSEDLRDLIETFSSELHLQKHDWKEILQISSREVEGIFSGRREVSAHSFYHLAQHFSLNLEDLSLGTINFQALRERINGNLDYLDPKYLVAAFSRRHTVQNALNFIENIRGPHLRETVNRHFQVYDSYWKDGAREINILFMQDLWRFLERKGIQDYEFRNLGRSSVFLLKNTPMGEKLSQIKKPSSLYEYVCSEIHPQFDLNCRYELVFLKSKKCVIESRSHPDVTNQLKLKRIGSLNGCQVRAGIFGSASVYIGRGFSEVRETLCEHQGASKCRFEIHFSEQKNAPLSDLFQRVGLRNYGAGLNHPSTLN